MSTWGVEGLQHNGTETRLADCSKNELGMVTKCENRHYAGVICYDREGWCQKGFRGIIFYLKN